MITLHCKSFVVLAIDLIFPLFVLMIELIKYLPNTPSPQKFEIKVFCSSSKVGWMFNGEDLTYRGNSPGARLRKLLRFGFAAPPFDKVSIVPRYICNQKIHVGNANSWQLPKHGPLKLSPTGLRACETVCFKLGKD